MTENEIAKIIFDKAFDIHTKFGPGLFKSVYEKLLVYKLKKDGFQVEK